MSLRLRLTLTYGVLVALILALFGTILYGTLRRDLEQEIDKRLRVRASQVELTIFPSSTSTPLLISSKLDLSPLDELNAPSLYVQVLNPQGTVVATSSNLGGTPLPTTGLGVASGSAGEERLETVRVGHGQSIRLLSQPITSQGSVVGILQVGQSRQPLQQTLGDLRTLLLVLSGAALLVCVGIGWLVAQHGLRPIRAIAHRAAALTACREFGEQLGLAHTRTEVGQLAQTIDALLATVHDLLRQHRAFVADTSHELRNPLLAIQTNLELLPRVRTDAEQEECIAEAQEQIGRMSRLVEELLLLARAETTQVIECQPVRVVPLVARAVEQARHQAHGQCVALGPRAEVTVLGDAGRLGQILTNLLSNALEHTPAGGRITVAVQREGEGVCLVVEDTGEGIPEADLPHIFDRFYQARHGGRRPKHGSGLGLAIVAYLTRAHGGRVCAESTPGVGSRFTVWLPAVRSDGAL